MLHRGIKFAHAALLLFSALLAFVVVRGMDEQDRIVLGTSGAVEVNESRNAASNDRVLAEVESFARQHRVNVVRWVPDLHDPEHRRQLYVAVGDPQAEAGSWLGEGYPAFSREVRTDVHPMEHAGQLDPRGFYHVFGSPGAAEKLRAEFVGLGFDGRALPAPSVGEWAPLVLGDDAALLWCFLLVALAAVVAIGSGVLLNARAYGVLRLQGWSFPQILGRDMRQLARFWFAAAAVTAAVSLAGLWVYNGLDRWGLFALVAAGLLTLFVLPALTAHVLTLGLTSRTPILRAVKGEVSDSLTMASAYSVRIPALLLTFAIALAAGTAGGDLIRQQAGWHAYSNTGQAVHLRLNGSAGLHDQAGMDAAVGSWLRRSDQRGEVVLAVHSALRDMVQNPAGVPKRDLLVVNDTFLDRQPVWDPAGRRHTGVGQGEPKAQILIPQSLTSQSNRISAELSDFARNQARFAGAPQRGQNMPVDTLPMRSGQSVFTYGSGMGEQGHQPLIRDPVILVVSGGDNGVLSDSTYAAYATQIGVVFPNPRDVTDAMAADQNLRTYIRGVVPVAQFAAGTYAETAGELRFELFNLAAALAVLALTAISVSLIYRRKNAQLLFVRHISGWSLLTMHRGLLGLEILLAMLPVGWVGWNTWITLSELHARQATGRPIPPGSELALNGWEPVVMLAIATFGLGLVCTAIATSHHRFIRRRATEL